MILPIVMKNDESGRWYTGSLEICIFKDKGELKANVVNLFDLKRISKKSQVENIESYTTLNKISKQLSTPFIKVIDEFIKKNGISRIYFYKFPKTEGVREFEKIWWANINSRCAKCRHVCKQSAYVDVEDCNKFEPRR